MKIAVFLFIVILAALVASSYIHGENINDKKAANAASSEVTKAPEQATIEALQTQVAQLANSGSTEEPTATSEPTQTPLTPEPKSTAKAGDDGGSNGESSLSSRPNSVDGWIALVAKKVEGKGNIQSEGILDSYGAIEVRFDEPWTLPQGWSAHASGNTLWSGELYPGVWSVYPPCSWRSSLNLAFC